MDGSLESARALVDCDGRSSPFDSKASPSPAFASSVSARGASDKVLDRRDASFQDHAKKSGSESVSL